CVIRARIILCLGSLYEQCRAMAWRRPRPGAAFMIKQSAISGTQGSDHNGADIDPEETREWLDALDSVLAHCGQERARFLLHNLTEAARNHSIVDDMLPYSAYRNTISVEKQPPYPGDLGVETRLTGIMRWNALAMVARANKAFGGIGGHIASYAAAAEIFELGFNHFFRGPEAEGGADLVYFQPHSATGVYARAYLEGRLDEAQLNNFR